MKNQTYRMTMLFDFYGDILTPRQRELFDLYYNEDLSLAEIAENCGISRQGVRDSIKRGETIILDLEEKVGFAGRYRAVRQSVARIEELAKDIRFENEEEYIPSERITQDVEEILTLIGKISE